MPMIFAPEILCAKACPFFLFPMYGPRLFIFFDLVNISIKVLTLLSYNLATGKFMKLKVLSDL